jgi:hypothetical protein
MIAWDDEGDGSIRCQTVLALQPARPQIQAGISPPDGW